MPPSRYQILTTNGKIVDSWGLGEVGGKAAKNQTGEELQQMRYATLKIYQILTTNDKIVDSWGWGEVGGKAAKNQTGEGLQQMRYATLKIYQILTTNGKMPKVMKNIKS